jgi:PEP-CTERM motif
MVAFGYCLYRFRRRRTVPNFQGRVWIVGLMIGCAGLSQATVSWQAASVVSDSGGSYPICCDVSVAFDQNGLLTPYTSGVTDWASYFLGDPLHNYVSFGPDNNPLHDNEWFANVNNTSANIIVDLGLPIPINQIALWNEDAIGVGQMTVLGSNDVTFSTFTNLGTFNPTPNPLGQNYGAQLFTFSVEATVRYVELQVIAPPEPQGYQGSDYEVSIGQIAFSADIPPIPEPGTWSLIGLGLATSIYLGRMRRRT